MTLSWSTEVVDLRVVCVRMRNQLVVSYLITCRRSATYTVQQEKDRTELIACDDQIAMYHSKIAKFRVWTKFTLYFMICVSTIIY